MVLRQAAEVNLTMKSFNSNATLRGGVLQILRKMATSVLAITAVLVLVGTVIGMSGCSGKKSSKDPSVSSSRQDSSQTQAAATPALTTVEKPAVTARKKTVRRARTVAYSSGTYGVSFRFPGEYTLTTPGGDDSKSTLAEGVPTNFVQPGGLTLATIELPSGSSTSFFSVSAHKGLTSQQCQQFGVPDPSDVAGNSPVDSNDGSIPSKANIYGVEFAKVENATEQEDVKYYHHFEPGHDVNSGTCYEFAMGVEESRVSSRTLDYSELFDKLDRIMATVKIKSEPPAVTATVPTHESGTAPQ